MKRSWFVGLGTAALSSFLAIGCAGSTDDSAAPEAGEEEDLTARQLPGVTAVEIAEVHMRATVLNAKTVGAPKKVKSIVTGVKKLKASDPVPRCLMQDTTRLTFLDAAGKKVATVDSYCGGYGSISFESGQAGYGVKFDGGAVDAAKNAPFAVGDALWAISKIEISKPGSNADKKTISGNGLEPILGGFDLDEVPDAHASFPRCLPSHAVTFKRGNDNVAFTSFVCGSVDAAHAPASIKAQFTAVDPKARPDTPALASGAIQIDPRPVLRALEPTQ